MTEQPLVSIIIPTYNRAHLIGETLDSVMAQTYSSWECIVVDDGSTDKTEELILKYETKDSRFQYHKRPDTHLAGGNGARNYGFELSKGNYVNWFDSDDVMHPNKLELQLQLLLESQKAFCVCQTLIFEESIENIIGVRKEHLFSKDPLNDFITSKITWLTQAPVFLKSFLVENNLRFNENLLKAQEYEFFIKVLYVNADYAYTYKPLAYIRKHDNQISNAAYQSLKSYSMFKASYNAFKLVHVTVKKETKNNLVRRMNAQIYSAIDHNHLDLARKMKNEIIKLKTSYTNTFFLQLGFYSYQLFGYKKILSFMSSKKKKTFKSFVLHKI